jgi:adenosylmethionine-8-amino-7-oxononanoate aminotransferase
MIWAFDVDHAPPGFSRDFHRRALERGLFIRPIGGTVYFMPPYVIEEPEMALMARITLELLDQS